MSEQETTRPFDPFDRDDPERVSIPRGALDDLMKKPGLRAFLSAKTKDGETAPLGPENRG